MTRHSVILPTAGRSACVRGAIDSLLRCPLDEADAELIVVDNNSDAALTAGLRAHCDGLAGRMRYVHEPSPGLSAARHRGAAEAAGELLTFIDDDVEVRPGWLPAIQEAFGDPGTGLVGGPSLPRFTGTVPAWFWGFLEPVPGGGWCCPWLSLLDLGSDRRPVDPVWVWGLNFSIRKAILHELGGFHPDLVPRELQRWQGDGETGLSLEFAARGHRASYVQEAGVYHLCGDDRLNPGYFARRAFYQGVCDSYTRIRAGDPPRPGSSPASGPTTYRRVRSGAGRLWRSLRRGRGPWGSELDEVKRQAERAYLDGWRFHQDEVARDGALLEWVRREDYFDTDIRALVES